MRKIKNKKYRYILNGIIAVLPILILLLFYRWIWDLLVEIIGPLIFILSPSKNSESFFIILLALAIVIFSTFLIGKYLVISENQKRFLKFENKFFLKLPGYNLLKRIIRQLFYRNKRAFSKAAIVNTFGNEVEQIAFITDKVGEDKYVVFVPTGPNPTSGNIYILPSKYVRIIDVHVEKVMRTIVACGVDGANLIFNKKEPK